MKRIIILILVALLLESCSDSFLDIQPLDRVPASQLLNDPNGVKVILANLYNQMPVEDFSYNPGKQFNYHKDQSSNFVDFGWSTSVFTDESTLSHGSPAGPVNDGYWEYSGIRDVNLFFTNLDQVQIEESHRQRLKSEAHFIRAYMYFGLAKRYGGVPIIDGVLEYQPGGENAELFVPRSTEKQTWDFILSELDKAIEYLPASVTAQEGTYRATKWSAYGLKSRAALFAASISKYWNRAPLVGQAVDEKLLGGMEGSESEYYQQCIIASQAIIENSGKALYKPNPADPVESAKNYQDIFQNASSAEVRNEILFSKAYIDGSATRLQGHSYDVHFNPSQTNPGYIAYGRFSPTLDLVDLYEDYSDNGLGESAEVVTRTDGNENYVVADPTQLDVNLPFQKYSTLTEPFSDKDARLHASVIVPGSTWKGIPIIMQGGLITTGGTPLVFTENSATGNDGNTYFTYGASAPSGYSGFRGLGSFDNANYSVTGFSLKKFLQEGKNVQGLLFSSTTDFIDIRLAEIYLNYAEAVVESGQGDAGLAASYLNALRKRAGHTDEIPFTLENVLKERRIELAFEGHRYWDLIRRREYHDIFNATSRIALVPILDLRGDTPMYIFVRSTVYYDRLANGRTFQNHFYYRAIPDVTNNRLIQNPQY